MALTPGTRFGPYEVTALIGEGGMGQVYRATDTNLKRPVALKVLPEAMATDAERLARFQREAEVLARLNHPNIAQVHGLEKTDGTTALVMELVEGPTLGDRIARGPVAIDEALPIARQMADALEAAHEQGIVHRDLKPANIKVRPDGVVKVLDFGLAKALESMSVGSGATASPTITSPAMMTGVGVLLGTAAYMSPEQARGKPVDTRADIWAFGCVLYEMLTGARPFAGDDVSETLARVIEREPDWAALPGDVPPVLSRFVRSCLHKNPKQRIHHIADLRLALEGAFETPVAATTAPVVAMPLRFWQRPFSALVLATVFLAIGALAVWMLIPAPTRPIARFIASMPDAPSGPSAYHDLAISPDGSRIVYVTGSARQLHMRPVDRLEGVSNVGGVSATSTPFFSPDAAWLGFADMNEGAWRKVSILGGPPVTLWKGPTSFRDARDQARGATWGPDDTIIFAHAAVGTGLFRGPAAGGAPEVLTTPDASKGEQNHWWPEFLPGGRGVLFTIVKGAGDQNREIALLDVHTRQHKVLIPGGSQARYTATGHIVYGAEGTLRAVPFDLGRLEVTGAAVTVVENVTTVASSRTVNFAMSANGSLVYATGGPSFGRRTLVWVDRDGREEPVNIPPRAYRVVRLSPSGTQVALWDNDIWIFDLVREVLHRLTTDSGGSPRAIRSPVWSPNGERVAFSAGRDGNTASIYWQTADGSGSAERLSDEKTEQIPASFTPDGTKLLFVQPGTLSNDIGMIALDAGRRTTMLLTATFWESSPEVSPDGRWLAYESNESGRDLEIYVRPVLYPNVSRRQISTNGGVNPLWSRVGRELFYWIQPDTIMRVPVESGPELRLGAPTVAVRGSYAVRWGLDRHYDISPDGKRFLLLKETDEQNPPHANVVLNWFEEQKRLVPTKGPGRSHLTSKPTWRD